MSAAINFAKRYSDKAKEMAAVETNPTRKAELLQIAANCEKVPANGATNFYEACQSFIITQSPADILNLQDVSTSICTHILKKI